MKRRSWKIIFGAFAFIALCFGLLVGDAHWRAAETIERHLKDVEALRQAYLKREGFRPSGFEEELEGNAWDDYVPAFRSLGAIPQELLDLMPEFEPEIYESGPDDHAIHNLLQEQRAALDLIRRGLRRREVRLPGLTLAGDEEMRYVAEATRASRLLQGASSHARRMGNDREAVEAARSVLALAGDFGRNGPAFYALLQFLVEWRSLAAFKELFERHSLDVPDLSGLAAWLDRQERSRPDALDAWAAEDIQVRAAFAESDWEKLSGRDSMSWPTNASWRSLYSRRITRAQALNQFSEFIAELGRLRALPPWERVAQAPSSVKRFERNPLQGWTGPMLTHFFRRDAVTQLQRTLLRVAVAAAWYEAERGRFPAKIEDLIPRYLLTLPPCPLTGLPLHAADGKVWSPGINRIDDGGVEMDPDRPSEDGGTAGDVVWTVKRR